VLEEDLMANYEEEGDKPVSANFNAPLPPSEMYELFLSAKQIT